MAKIVLEVGGKEIVLTIEEAKKLRDELNEVFGGRTDFVLPQGWRDQLIEPITYPPQKIERSPSVPLPGQTFETPYPPYIFC